MMTTMTMMTMMMTTLEAMNMKKANIKHKYVETYTSDEVDADVSDKINY